MIIDRNSFPHPCRDRVCSLSVLGKHFHLRVQPRAAVRAKNGDKSLDAHKTLRHARTAQKPQYTSSGLGTDPTLAFEMIMRNTARGSSDCVRMGLSEVRSCDGSNSTASRLKLDGRPLSSLSRTDASTKMFPVVSFLHLESASARTEHIPTAYPLPTQYRNSVYGRERLLSVVWAEN